MEALRSKNLLALYLLTRCSGAIAELLSDLLCFSLGFLVLFVGLGLKA